MYLFEHLLDPAVTPVEDAHPMDVVGAQAGTLTWLQDLGAVTDDAPTDATSAALAREAFSYVTTPNTDPAAAKDAVLALRAPPAVRHLAGMLSQYDWDFVEQAKEIRGYVVSKLISHAENKDPRVSLAALKQLGTVTEIGLFTERVEITKRSADTTEIAQRLRQRLQALLPKGDKEVEDAVEVTPPHPLGGSPHTAGGADDGGTQE